MCVAISCVAFLFLRVLFIRITLSIRYDELKAIGLLIQFRLLNDNSFFVNLQKFTNLPYHIVVTKTGYHCHVLKHDYLICIRSTSRLELRLYCWQRVQICRKICGLGCVTRALVHAWFTQPSPNVYSCIFTCERSSASQWLTLARFEEQEVGGVKQRGYSLLKGGQTNLGQRLDKKSNLCPTSVKTLSNVCPCTRFVHMLSNSGTMSVRTLSKSPAYGQRLDKQIQGLSRFRQRGSSNLTINSWLDKVWTNSGCGQTLELSRIFNHLSQHPEFVQTLSSLKSLLRMELLVLCWTWPNAHGPPMAYSVPNHSTPMAHLVPNHAAPMAHSSYFHGTLMTLPWHTQGLTMTYGYDFSVPWVCHGLSESCASRFNFYRSMLYRREG